MPHGPRWWAGKADERYWLELTDREDIGADLRAPLVGNNGQDNWRYSLFREANEADVVFHYDKRKSAITSVSRIAGRPSNSPIIWAARGSYARERGARPVEVAGYRIPLAEHFELSEPVTLRTLRAASHAIRALHDKLAAEGRPLYFPFELSARPLRPLQGYAFKLPVDFVRLFPTLCESAGIPMPVAAVRPESEIFHAAIEAIEDSAGAYEIAGLQRLRARNRGLARVAQSIFGRRKQADDWAFHLGGRDELQFNVGLDVMPDGVRAFRAGVAFSFEPSRSLPDIEKLLPNVARFNAWMRENPETLADFAMWHFDHGTRSADYLAGPIPESLVRSGVFVFIGQRQPLPNIDPHVALRTFDRLLPLYAWVETRVTAALTAGTNAVANTELLRLDSGRDFSGGRWITATTHERALDIYLRHREIQGRLKAALLSEGCSNVVLEVSIGQRSIDLIAQHGDELWFYEVKTAATVRGCLREAIGQLLEYALWPGATRPARLVVVGEPALDAAAKEYLDRLNATFPIRLVYRQLALEQ